MWPHKNKWQGFPAVLIASGPSMDVELFPEAQEALDVAQAAHDQGKVKVGTANDACYLAPFTDLIYAGDRRWWKLHIESIRGHKPRPNTEEFYKFQSDLFTKDPGAAEMYNLETVRQRKTTGLDTEAPYVSHGGNSGYQLLNLAFHLGANPIYLLGYDCKNIDKHRTHKNHFFGNHPTGWGQANGVIDWAFYFKGIAKGLTKRGIKVINCSIDTAIEAFDRGVLRDFL